MNQKLIQQIGRSQRLEILNAIKRTTGMSVKELAEKLEMSYMGVKAHCIQLHKQNYLETWRRPKAMGRPELIYRLTKLTLDLFPRASNPLTLDIMESAAQTYGANAPDKLLYSVFQRVAERYKKRIKNITTMERATSLVRIRESEGYMSTIEEDLTGAFRIIEFHHPMLDMMEKYPIIGRLEEELFTNVLGVKVQRDAKIISGLYHAEFTPLP
jgi:predicted ArsR family transcriptional regulator